MHSERRRSSAPTPAFRRFGHMIRLLQNRGFPEKAIDAFIREKIAADLANHQVQQRQPSLN